MSDDNTEHSENTHNYRPKSPDLSDFSAPPFSKPSRLPSVSYPVNSGLPQGYQFSPRGSYDASPYFSPQNAQPTSYFGNQPHQFNLYTSQSQGHASSQSPLQYSSPPFPPPQTLPQDEMARLRTRPQVNYNDNAHPEDEFHEEIQQTRRPSRVPPIPQHPQQIQQIPPPMPAYPPQPQHVQQQQPMYPIQTQQAFYPGQIPQQPLYPDFQQQQQQQHHQQQQHFQHQFAPQPPVQAIQPPQQPALPPIDVRTKFPVARIKRIMQADEDIGKVAQATPTAVAKALECFMIALVSKGASDAKAQNSKRVTATHLKTALLADPQYDFLKEICENVPDESASQKKGARAKSEDSDAEEDFGAAAGGAAGKKRKSGAAGGGKKKKGADGGESD